jgi:lysophospholipase L1-like esterase
MKKLFLLAVVSVFVSLGLAPVNASANNTSERYVALGDSVAAGAGLPLKDDSPASRACGRSSKSYAVKVGEALGVSPALYACGGATVLKGIVGPQTAGGMTFTSQIEQAYSSAQRPTLITLTVGTNDIMWSDFIRKCYASTCGTWQDTVAAISLQKALFDNLDSALEQIHHKQLAGQPLPKVVLTGYFTPLSNEQPACADTQGLTAAEITWVQGQAHLLNSFIQLAAAKHIGLTRFAPVDFTGHELCSDHPWVQGLHDPASYHPTAKGQEVIAESVLRQL